jgi:hypothetical protein
MKVSKITIDTKEALNRLAHPTFFDHIERKSAYDIVMRDGTPVQKTSADQALLKWPIDGLKAKAAV